MYAVVSLFLSLSLSLSLLLRFKIVQVARSLFPLLPFWFLKFIVILIYTRFSLSFFLSLQLNLHLKRTKVIYAKYLNFILSSGSLSMYS